MLLGPVGVGLFAQLQGVQNLASQLVPLGMDLGALRYIAKYRKEDPHLLAQFVSSATKLFLLVSFIMTAACLIFVKPLAAWALGSDKLWLYLIPPVVGVPLLVQSQLWLVYVQAGLEIKAYTKVQVTTSILGLIMVAPLVYLWKQVGATFHLLAIAAISYFVARMYANKSMNREMIAEMKQARFDPKVVWTLMRFGGANLPVFAFDLLLPFLVRTQIIRDMGLSWNGIYQAMFVITTQYMAMPLTAMTTYSFPKISQLKEIKEINAEVNNGLKAALLFSTAGILLILPTRDLALRILYSSKFLPAVALFPMQMMGQLLRSVVWTIQMPMVPQERFRARIYLAVLHNVTFLSVFYLGPAHTRVQSAVLAYMVTWAVNLVGMYLYLHKVNGYTMGAGNRRLFAACVVAVGVVGCLPLNDIKLRLLALPIIGVWLLLAMSREDVAKFRAAIRERLSKGEASA